jgi:hypothetical protein
MPTNNAEGVAGRLAKFGVNNVRFHHMDASWAYGGGLLAYTSTKSTNFNASQLDRLHYLVSRLKAHGVYSDINLLVGREYRSGDGLGPEVATMDWKDAHILGYFYPPALELHKDYATKLLGPTNRYTGLPLAKDPAVAFVEIINENGIIQKWLDGGLDRLAPRYGTNLQARWNNWLAARYNSEAGMLAAWKVIDQALGPNLLANGAFSNGLTGWNQEQHNAAKATFQRTYEFTNGQPSAKITVTNADTQGWYIQMNYAGLALGSNQPYTISFWAKASPATGASSSVMMAHDPWQGLGYGLSHALTTNWEQFSTTFQASRTDGNARAGFSDMGNKLATFWYADVRLQTGGKIGVLPAGTSLAARTIPSIRYSGTGYLGTREARRDWVEFLRDLETEYYDTMVAHLRGPLQYPGLIFGTIMANSPATVQSRMDVIDSHAYWQHPDFPGTPWDSVNWTVQNISMVNTLDNTLSGIARQRLKGKPFVCTEYQHPSPNYYGAEGPLLLAAYAGLQDWDGIWLFDYGQGNPAVTMGYVRGFFEIGQHPTKMANLLAAANLFRRGDVRPAQQEWTMAMTPDRELDLLVNSSPWSIFGAGQLGLPGKLVFTNRVSTSVGTNPSGLTTAPPGPTASVVSSDTAELKWDTTVANKGLVTINTARTKGLVGFADNTTVSLGGVALRPGTTQLGWSTLMLTLVEGEVFTNDCRALLVASGWWENTGQMWKDANKNSVGNQWGTAPVLTEVVPCTVMLPVGTNYVRVWSLNERGQRKAELPVTGSESSTVITIGTNTASIWYEVEVGRWTTSFDQWRVRYFSAADLQDPAVSGETAAPEGDNLANLLKYYFGMAGDAPAITSRLPKGSLLTVSNAQYLAITYERDKMVTDVVCTPEVGSGLSAWSSGPSFTQVEQVLDLGTVERVTVRDLVASGDSAQRFMRLRFNRL